MLDFSGKRGFHENGILRIDDFSSTGLNFSFETLLRQAAFFINNYTYCFISELFIIFFCVFYRLSAIYFSSVHVHDAFSDRLQFFWILSFFCFPRRGATAFPRLCGLFQTFFSLKSSRVWENCTGRFRESIDRLHFCPP